MENLDLTTIINAALGLIGLVGGGFAVKFRGKFKKIFNVIKNGVLLLDDVENALEDNKVTPEEMKVIKKRLREFRSALKALTSKEK